MDIYFFELNLKENKNRIEQGKLQHKISRIILKKLLDEKYGINKEILENNGKPYIENNQIFFSISHSANLLGIAFAYTPIGFDIELIRERNFEGILNYFKINPQDISKDEFFQIWTTYEAEYKSGFSKNLKNFRFDNFMCAISYENTENFHFYNAKINELNAENELNLTFEDTIKDNYVSIKQLDENHFDFLKISDKKITIKNTK